MYSHESGQASAVVFDTRRAFEGWYSKVTRFGIMLKLVATTKRSKCVIMRTALHCGSCICMSIVFHCHMSLPGKLALKYARVE